MTLHRMLITAVSMIALFVFVTSASAAGKAYDLKVVPQHQSVTPGTNAVIDWSTTNNTREAASCTVSIREMGFTIFSGIIQPGTSAGGQVSTPAFYKISRFTFEMNCDGSVISRTISVKVR